ncbi:MAG: amidohydrolase family protein, partial [Chloroflexota bacterium]|nr:amidohydrolase family protein [Chloroflexota bacterium]
DASRRPTGVLHEAASSLLERAIPDPSETELEAALVRQASALAKLGVTGCHDPGELGREASLERGPLFYRRLASTGRLPLRVHASVRAAQLAQAIELGLRSGQGVAHETDQPSARRIADRYRMGWLKLFADGSLGSRSAALLEPYDDAAVRPPTGGGSGMLLLPPGELAALLHRAAEAGISGQVHAIGDAAVRVALDVLGEVRAGPLKRRIEHAQLVQPVDQPRFATLGVAASVQPVHLRTDAPAVRQAWGARGQHAFPLRGLANGGALIPFGTDAPVEPADPWPGIAVAVARRDPQRPANEPLGADHALDLPRSIRGACLDPPLAAGEGDLGRLLAGYRADLLIVPADGFRQPVDAAVLAATRPLLTMIDGETVYRDPAFAPR